MATGYKLSRKRRILCYCAGVLMISSLSTVQAQNGEQLFTLASVIQDSMVIQQGKPFRLWGQAKEDTRIIIKADWLKHTVTVFSKQGRWMAELPVPVIKQGNFTAHTVQLHNESHNLQLKGLLIGEVWICSGQSNMAMYMQPFLPWHNGAENYKEEIARANYPNIRLLTVEKGIASAPAEKMEGSWTSCTPASVAKFSVVAYYFARQLFKQLQVPVGVVVAAYGGAACQAFTSREALASDSLLRTRYLVPFDLRPDSFKANIKPTQIYNAMIHPLRHLSVRGFTWYQGESNAREKDGYRRLCHAMLEGWRKDFRTSDLPFYFVQLPPYNWRQPDTLANWYAFFREEQSRFLAVKNTGMVGTMDLGDSTTIHPSKKRQIGERLALLAMHDTYGKKVNAEGPVFASMDLSEDTAIIRYTASSVKEGLQLENGQTATEFWIAGADRRFYPALAAVRGKQVLVHHPAVKKPLAVRYAFTNLPYPTLTNTAGLPAFPFRTDDWKDAVMMPSNYKVVPLYADSIPNNTRYRMMEEQVLRNDTVRGYRKMSVPTLHAYLPSGTTGRTAAVVICPGGGYGFVNFLSEGHRIAEYFSQQGIAAFVLKYRLPSDSIMVNKSIGPLQDAQKAIWLVRNRAIDWNIDPDKLGIMGFSAGGHLAATASTHYSRALVPGMDSSNLRPDFSILIYPVISFKEPILHKGSMNALLGSNSSPEASVFFSNELQVDAKTPPAWITHAGDDSIVVVQNSLRYYEALQQHKVPAELHVFSTGGHGFVLRMALDEWMRPLMEWIHRTAF